MACAIARRRFAAAAGVTTMASATAQIPTASAAVGPFIRATSAPREVAAMARMTRKVFAGASENSSRAASPRRMSTGDNETAAAGPVRRISLSKVGPFREKRHKCGGFLTSSLSGTCGPIATHLLETLAELLELLPQRATCAHDSAHLLPIGAAGHQPLAMPLQLHASRLELVDGRVTVRQGGLESSC